MNVIETWMNTHVKCQQNILYTYFKYLKKDVKKLIVIINLRIEYLPKIDRKNRYFLFNK